MSFQFFLFIFVFVIYFVHQKLRFLHLVIGSLGFSSVNKHSGSVSMNIIFKGIIYVLFI